MRHCPRIAVAHTKSRKTFHLPQVGADDSIRRMDLGAYRVLRWGLAAAVASALLYTLQMTVTRPVERKSEPDEVELAHNRAMARPATREEARFVLCLSAVYREYGLSLTPDQRALALGAFRDSHPINFRGAPKIVEPNNERGRAIAASVEWRMISKFGCTLN
jgi:hypothetical protein